MEMNPVLLEIAASIGAAGVLGLVVGWMIRSTSTRHALMQQRIRNQLLQAEAILDKQTEIDQLFEQILAGDAERDELTRANRSLEEALRQVEQSALRQRGAAVEQRLRAYDAAAPAAGGRPNTVDWQAELFDEMAALETLPDDPVDGTAIDATITLTDAFDEDATVALDDPLGAGNRSAAPVAGSAAGAPSRVGGFVKRETLGASTSRTLATGSR